jgi:hypothetical protein
MEPLAHDDSRSRWGCYWFGFNTRANEIIVVYPLPDLAMLRVT